MILKLQLLLILLSAAWPAVAGVLPDNRFSVGTVKIDLGGEYRVRGENQNNYNVKAFGPDADDDFVLSRFRLDIAAEFTSSFKTVLQFQDARIFGGAFEDGDFLPSNPYHDNMDIRLAYMDVNAARNLEFMLGRQSISFRDSRIFGPGNFGNTGRYVWDAARMRFYNSSIDSHTFAGRYILRDPDRWPNKPADGPTVYANYTMIKHLPVDFDLFYVLKNDVHGDTQGESGPGDLACHSTGFALNGATGPWDYGLTAASQFGHRGKDDVNAYGMATRLGYTLTLPWTPHVMIQFINGSGDENPEDGRSNTFDGIFSGSDTVLYGWMGLFFWPNTREYRLDMEVSPADTLSFKAEYHFFELDEPKDAWYYPGKAQRRDVTGNSGGNLGHEIDLSFHWGPLGWLDLLAGYCMFFPGEFIENTGPAPDASWTFLQASISF